MSTHSQLETTSIQYESDRPKAQNPIKIMDVSLRDGHQSLFATRGRTEDMIPVAEMMDEIGFWAVETWGGATFDTMHRFLNEDPWERIRTLKRYFKKTKFSMLLRAQNLVGYRNYADDLAKAFVERSAENGMDIFRTFDALNDYRNFETVVKAIKAAGKHFQGCICYSLTEARLGGNVYDLDYFVNKAKALESMGADSICIKDMAGLIAPYDAYDVITAIKSAVSAPVHLHTHFTSGMASMVHLKAIEAGVDILDTCMSPYAFRTSHPAIEPLVMSLLGTNRDTGFDVKKLTEINDVLEKEIMPKYAHLLNNTKMSIIDTDVLLHQTPGGMLSNLVNQLRGMDALHKLDKVFEELPKVRKELGQIPLVTPTSQIVGIQTVNNVLFDDENERYKMITDQVKDLCYGLYGKTAVPIDKEVQKKALKGYSRGETPITCRPAEILEPELEKARETIKDIASDIDDEILFALFPVTGKKFLQWKYGKECVPDNLKPKTLVDALYEQKLVQKVLAGELDDKDDKKEKEAPEQSENSRTFDVFVDGDYFKVDVDEPGGSPVINFANTAMATMPAQATAPAVVGAPVTQNLVPSGIIPPAPPAPVAVSAPAPAKQVASAPVKPTADKVEGTPVTAPMPGMIVSYSKQEGETVEKGDTVVILEAMKMENALPAPASGVLKSINYSSGDSVAKNDVLCIIQ